MRPGLRRGAIIGLVDGLLTGPTMLVWLLVFSVVRPDKHLGSTAVLGPFMGGIQSTVFGVVFGALAGAIALLGIRLIGLRRCVVFGVILMRKFQNLLRVVYKQAKCTNPWNRSEKYSHRVMSLR